MKLSNATCYYYEFSAEECVKHFAASGWDCIELSTEHSEELLLRGGDPAKTGREFLRHASDTGVAIPQAHLSLQIDITDDDDGHVTDELKRWLDMYLGMGIKSAVLHPGGHRYGRAHPEMTLAELQERRLRALRILTEHIKGSDLSICLENVGYCGSCEALNAIIDPIGDKNLGICLDTGHLNLSFHRTGRFGETYRQAHFIRTAGQRLRALHIHDNDGTGDQHLMPYTHGNIDFREVMTALREIGCEHPLNLEIPGESRDLGTDTPYPVAVRCAKSKYLFELFDILQKI